MLIPRSALEFFRKRWLEISVSSHKLEWMNLWTNNFEHLVPAVTPAALTWWCRELCRHCGAACRRCSCLYQGKDPPHQCPSCQHKKINKNLTASTRGKLRLSCSFDRSTLKWLIIKYINTKASIVFVQKTWFLNQSQNNMKTTLHLCEFAAFYQI